MKTKSISKLRRRRDAFCNIKNVKDLEKLLNESSFTIHLMALKPDYHIFTVPKKNGKKRWIEDPVDNLKRIQRTLNFYLQCVYFFNRTDAAYGFLLSAKNDPDPRNILTNARKHINQKYLFNADFKDFFHQVKWQDVFDVFTNYPFDFKPTLAELLSNLTTHNGRLPMGAPTSPVLSNFATMELDKKFLELSQWAGWEYTRFADDLSFSSDTDITAVDKQKIVGIAEACSLEFNQKKFKYYGPDDVKIVTGLVVNDDVYLPIGYLDELNLEIQKLNHVLDVQYYSGQNSAWVKKYQEKVEGMLNFANYILGDDDENIIKLENELNEALNPSKEYGAMSWLDFSYFKIV